MAPTRERDRHGTPILISDSPPRSSRSKLDLAPRGGVSKLPPKPPPAQDQSALRVRSAERLSDLHSVNKTVKISNLRSNDINAARQPVDSTTGPSYGLGLPAALQPIPNIAKMLVDEYSRRFPPGSKLHVSRPNYDLAPPPANQKFPFNVKHSILCAMQRLMEESLFYWAKNWIPGLVERQGWETPEAGELNQWLGAMQKWIIPPNAFSQSSGMNLYKIRVILKDRLHHIRHAAVHRKPTSAESLKIMLADAQLLTNGLRDVSRSNRLQAMALAMEFYDIKAMEAIIAAPISVFNTAVKFQSFQTQTGHFGNDVHQNQNIDPIYTIPSSGSDGLEKILLHSHGIRSWQWPEDIRASNQQPGMSGSIQLGRQLSKKGVSATNSISGLGNSSDMPIQSVEREGVGHEQLTSVQKSRKTSEGSKRSETIKLEAANHQSGIIKYLGLIDLTMDSDDGNSSLTTPVSKQLKGVIDLTADEHIVLFRSARAVEIKDD